MSVRGTGSPLAYHVRCSQRGQETMVSVVPFLAFIDSSTGCDPPQFVHCLVMRGLSSERVGGGGAQISA